MIILLIIYILLLAQVQSESPYDKRKLLRIFYKEFFNDVRHEYSIGLQIANMQELSYNIELEQEAKSFVTCEDIKNTDTFRFLLLETAFSKGFISPFLTNVDARWIKLNETNILDNEDFKRNAEFLHPLQNEIACVDLISKCPLSEKLPGKKADSICLFGPKSSEPMPAWIKGKPMSHCPNGKTDSGLCKSDLD